jgi:hypothetical protein
MIAVPHEAPPTVSCRQPNTFLPHQNGFGYRFSHRFPLAALTKSVSLAVQQALYPRIGRCQSVTNRARQPCAMPVAAIGQQALDVIACAVPTRLLARDIDGAQVASASSGWPCA